MPNDMFLFQCKNRMLNTILFSLGHCMKEIFSSWTHKTEHFQNIHRKTGIPYKSMLFFDDEDRNIDPVITYSHCAFLILAISKIQNILLTTFCYIAGGYGYLDVLIDSMLKYSILEGMRSLLHRTKTQKLAELQVSGSARSSLHYMIKNNILSLCGSNGIFQ